MARVFSIPHYKHSALNFLRAISQSIDTDVSRAAIAGCFSMDLNTGSSLLYSLGIDYSEGDEVVGRAYDIGSRMDVINFLMVNRIASVFCDTVLPAGIKVYSDSDAAIRILGKYMDGTARIRRIRDIALTRTEDVAKRVASIGLLTSFATPSLTRASTNCIKSYNYLSANFSRLCDCYDVSETWRMAVSSSKSVDHVRDCIRGTAIFDVSNTLLTGGRFAQFHPSWKTYIFMGISVHIIEGCAYILDNVKRGELQEVLFTAGQSIIYAANHPDTLAIQCAKEAADYVSYVIDYRIREGKRLDSIASQMKKSYAVALAMYSEEGVEVTEVDREQAESLKLEADGVSEGEKKWYDVFSTWPAKLAVDIGTVWNVLPGVDADPFVLADALKEKMEAPKVYSKLAWVDFINYSRGAITAHILSNKPSTVGEWIGDDGDPEELDWVKSCRAGVLAYPPDGNTTFITNALKWDNQVEFWHYMAKDVTHVNSIEKEFSTRSSVLHRSRADANELIYALKYAPLLSKEWSPILVKALAKAGIILGKRICNVSAKGENTKIPKKVRETESADDIMRELLSEIETNFRRLAKNILGATSGMSKADLEKITHGIIMCMTIRDILISLDFIGWSPNAPRVPYFEFQDMLCTFFDTTIRPSKIFIDVMFVISSSGSHTTWTSRDGTCQGFMVSGDTMLNCLMCQWAFRCLKREGYFNEGAKIKKIALIDDVLIRLNNFGSDMKATCEQLIDIIATLGYRAEYTKTLISSSKGHFLNRLYSNSQEVITASKIFARADREYERRFTTIWDRIDSVFGSFLGASDRGANPVACYTVAIHRAFAVMYSCNSTIELSDIMAVVCNVFLPRCIGGYGFPTFAQWATKESTISMASGVGVIATLVRTFENTDRRLCEALNQVIVDISMLIPVPRSAVSTIDNPFTLDFDGVSNPGSCISSLLMKGFNKCATSKVFINLIKLCESTEYESDVELLLRSTSYPAPVLSEFAQTLPHSVLRNLTIAAQKNETVLSFVERAEITACHGKLMKANRDALLGVFRIIGKSAVANNPIMSASTCLARLFQTANALEGYNITCRHPPSILDCISQVTSRGHFMVTIPAFNSKNMLNAVQNGSIVRTHVSKPIVKSENADGDRADPTYRSFIKLCCIGAVVTSYGSDARPLENLWAKVTVGNSNIRRAKGTKTKGSNPIRLSSRITSKAFSCMAWPNAVSTVSVNADSGIKSFENLRMTVPFLGVVYVLKCVSLLDSFIGGTGGARVIRHYSFRASEGIFDTSDYPGEFPEIDFNCARSLLSREESRIFSSKMLGDGIGLRLDEEIFGITRESLSITAFEVICSRGERAMGSLTSRLLGAANLITTLPENYNPTADVASAAKKRTREDVVKTIGDTTVERNAIRLIFRISLDKADPQLLGDVRAFVGRCPDFVRTSGFANAFKNFISSGGKNISKLDDLIGMGSAARSKDISGYYMSTAEDFASESSRDTVSIKVRVTCFVKSCVLANWGILTQTTRDAVKVLSTTFSGIINAIKSCTLISDNMDPFAIDELVRDLTVFYQEGANAALKTKSSFQEAILGIIMSYISDDCVYRVELRDGIAWALGAIEKWYIADFLGPAAAAEGFIVRENSISFDGSFMPAIGKASSSNISSFPGEMTDVSTSKRAKSIMVTKMQAAINRTNKSREILFQEFCRLQGLEGVEDDEEIKDEFEAWIRESYPDSNTDV